MQFRQFLGEGCLLGALRETAGRLLFWAAHSPLPLVLQDERLSTSAVTRTLLEADASRKRRGQVVDKMAAAYILQGALDRLRTLRHVG